MHYTYFTHVCRNRTFLPTPFSTSLPLLLSLPPHPPFCSEALLIISPHTYKCSPFAPIASVQSDQLPQYLFIRTNSINNANEPPPNYFLSLWCEDPFGARTRGGEGQCHCSPCLPPTHPPAFQQRLTLQNLITLLTCPICSVAGRQGFNYVCTGDAGNPDSPSPREPAQHPGGRGCCQSHPGA